MGSQIWSSPYIKWDKGENIWLWKMVLLVRLMLVYTRVLWHHFNWLLCPPRKKPQTIFMDIVLTKEENCWSVIAFTLPTKKASPNLQPSNKLFCKQFNLVICSIFSQYCPLCHSPIQIIGQVNICKIPKEKLIFVSLKIHTSHIIKKETSYLPY